MSWAVKIEELVHSTKGRLTQSGKNEWLYGVGTDTRQSLSGKIFFALKGENHDGHDYLPNAIAAGASALVVENVEKLPQDLKSTFVIQVEDTLKALQDFAHFWRERNKFKVIGITGSNGKTTTKEFTATLLKSHFQTHWSQGSFNNHWGVPLTILGASAETEVIVCEMGMNHEGELTTLCQIAQPDIVTCTTVGRAHMGHFKDMDQIAAAKSEIYEASPRALGLFNQDHTATRKMQKQWLTSHEAKNTFAFSTREDSTSVYLHLEKSEMGGLQVRGHIGATEGQALVPIFGEHNVQNLACAAALAWLAGVPEEKIWQALPQVGMAWGRNQWIKGKENIEIFFDGYNANPDSYLALIKNLQSLPHTQKWWGVFGEMREMGTQSEAVHREVGAALAVLPFQQLIFVGEWASAMEQGYRSGEGKSPVQTFALATEAVSAVQPSLLSGCLVVAKGSRGVAIEKALALLVEGGLKKP